MSQTRLAWPMVALVLVPLLAGACAADTEVVEPDEEELRGAKVGVNDVSWLYPLPAPGTSDGLIPATAEGLGGPLLPASVYAKVPPLVSGRAPALDAIRVTSVRIDPCFAALSDEGVACKNQIRMVLQPIRVTAGEPTLAEDAAIHAFYSIDRPTLRRFVQRYLDIKKQQGSFRSVPLGVHPLLKKGLSGAAAVALRALLLEFAGQKNLSRITFFTREPSRQSQWRFGGFDLDARGATAMKIASLGDVESQTVSNGGFNGFAITATPAPRAVDNISPLWFGAQATTLPRATALKTVQAALRIENPSKHSPDTIDCASCHTTHARAPVAAHFGFELDADTNRFSATRLTLRGANNTSGDNLHAFSYHFDSATVSQRTVNESASAADLINAKVLP